MEESTNNNGPLVRVPSEDKNAKEAVLQAQLEENTEDIRVTEEPTEPTPSELVNLGRPPYIVDLMDLRMAYETFDIKEQVAEIDEYLREGLEDSRHAYEQALNGLKNSLELTGDLYVDVAKMREYVRIQNKIRGVIKEREEFEKKDPEKMSAQELRRYFKEHE